MEDTTPQHGTAQKPENATQFVDYDRMMPGLVTPLVETFKRPRAHLTVRGAARRKQVPETFMITAVFRDLYSQVADLRAAIARRPINSEMSVREFVSQKRSAA